MFDSSTLTSSLCRLRRSWHYLYLHSSADFLKTSWHTALKANLSHMRSWHTVYFLLLLLLLIVNVSDAGSICWHVTCKSPLISHTLSQTTFAFTCTGRGGRGSEILMMKDSIPPAQSSPVIICLFFPQVLFHLNNYDIFCYLSTYMARDGTLVEKELICIFKNMYVEKQSK